MKYNKVLLTFENINNVKSILKCIHNCINIYICLLVPSTNILFNGHVK